MHDTCPSLKKKKKRKQNVQLVRRPPRSSLETARGAILFLAKCATVDATLNEVEARTHTRTKKTRFLARVCVCMRVEGVIA